MIRLTSPTSHRFHGKGLMLILVVSLSLLATCDSNAGSAQSGGSSGSTQVVLRLNIVDNSDRPI